MKDALGHGSNGRAGGARKPIPNHPYHAKSSDELRYIIKDASEAARNAQDMGKLETKYNDQVNDAATVLGYRDRGGAQDAPGHGLIEGMQSKLKDDIAAGRMLHSGTSKSDAAPVHDSMSVGDRAWLGFGAKGGAGFPGKITKLDDHSVSILHDNGKTYSGPRKFLSK
jgi:hypothetical protein